MAAPMEDVSKMSSEKKYTIEVTVVTGFEDVAKEEAEEKLGTEVRTKPGRISFELSLDEVTKILNLGSANHCMVVMKYKENFQFTEDEHENLNRMRELAGEIDWTTGLEVWSKFFSFDLPIKDTPDTLPTDYGEVTLLSGIHKSNLSRAQKIKEKMRKRKRHKKKEQSFKAEQKLDANNGDTEMDTNVIDKDNKNCTTVKESESSNIVNLNEKQSTGGEQERAVESESNSISKPNKTDVTIHKESDSSKSGETVSNTADEITDKQNDNKNVTLEDGTQENIDESPAAKKPRIRQNPWNPLMPSFRVTCNRTGEGHSFNSMNAAANLGGGIWHYFGWNVKMTEMDIEVIMNITNQEVTVGIGLTREVLHKGNIVEFGRTTLRPSICYGLLRLCDIKPGDIVCDPMCGVGSISIRGASYWPDSYHLGADIVGNAVKKCQSNFDFVNEQSVIKTGANFLLDVSRWNTCNMPLRNASVDVFVSDLPFGIRVGKKTENWKLYNDSLTEMARCSKISHTRACLLTEDKNCMIKTLQKLSKYWHRVKTLTVNVGGLSAGVYLLKRTSAAFQHKTEDKESAS